VATGDKFLFYVAAGFQSIDTCMKHSNALQAWSLEWFLPKAVLVQILQTCPRWAPPEVELFHPTYSWKRYGSTIEHLSKPTIQDPTWGGLWWNSESIPWGAMWSELPWLLQFKGPKWVFGPKLHSLDHLILEMKSVVDRGGKPLDSLAYSCGTEDFIGKASMLRRRQSVQWQWPAKSQQFNGT